MENGLIDILGYSAAVFTNISIYPLAFNIYCTVRDEEYVRLQSISFNTHLLMEIGCFVWLVYAYLASIYPILVGTTIYIIPNSYIILIIIYHWENIYYISETGISIEMIETSNNNDIEIITDSTKIEIDNKKNELEKLD